MLRLIGSGAVRSTKKRKTASEGKSEEAKVKSEVKKES